MKNTASAWPDGGELQRAAEIVGRRLAARERRLAALEIGRIMVAEIDEDRLVAERQERLALAHDLHLRIDAAILDAEIEQALVAEDDIAGGGRADRARTGCGPSVPG